MRVQTKRPLLLNIFRTARPASGRIGWPGARAGSQPSATLATLTRSECCFLLLLLAKTQATLQHHGCCSNFSKPNFSEPKGHSFHLRRTLNLNPLNLNLELFLNDLLAQV